MAATHKRLQALEPDLLTAVSALSKVFSIDLIQRLIVFRRFIGLTLLQLRHSAAIEAVRKRLRLRQAN